VQSPRAGLAVAVAALVGGGLNAVLGELGRGASQRLDQGQQAPRKLEGPLRPDDGSPARAEAVGATANVGIAERAERLLIVGAAVLLAGLGVPYVLPAALWILGGLGLITVAQRVATVRRQLHPGSGSLGD